jgi:NAD(P)-dependent dehydrogenase (short-subunit alcohol dehydrogenase family)
MNKINTLIVTGAGDGLGKALSFEASKKGLELICISKSENAMRVAKEINVRGGRAIGLQCDLSKLDGIKESLAGIKIDLNKKNIAFVLCAGTLGSQGGFLDTDIREWVDVYNTNVLGNLEVLKFFSNHILKNNFSKIIFIAGGGSAYGYPAFSSYSLSKTAVVRAAENVHLELKNKGEHTVIALAPGAMPTKMLEKVKASGAEIKTTVPVEETVKFILKIIENDYYKISGKFVHVRDDVDSYSIAEDEKNTKWQLRRYD